MSNRTMHSIVHFDRPFALPGLDGIHPAGDYGIDEDEEPIAGLSWLAYRRVGAYIHLPARSLNQGVKSQLVAIDYLELQTALQRDKEQGL